MKILIITVVLFFELLCSGALYAGEVDNYYAWGHDIKDCSAEFNDYLNIQIKTILERINRNGRYSENQCNKAALKIMKKLGGTLYLLTYRGALNTDMEYWAQESPSLHHSPALGESLDEYGRQSIYAPEMKTFGFSTDLDVVVNVGGVYFGTDKISHFLGSGFEYYRKYHKFRKKHSETMAKALAIKWGVNMENGIIGTKAVGVFSYADLEANFQGMEMAVDFCSQPAPNLNFQNDKWQLARAVDLRDYINPNWDESYNTSVYTKSRLKKVKANIEELELCNKLESPWVKAFIQSYEDKHTNNYSTDGYLDTGLSSRLLYFSQKHIREPFDQAKYVQFAESYRIDLSYEQFSQFNKDLKLRDQQSYSLRALCSPSETENR